MPIRPSNNSDSEGCGFNSRRADHRASQQTTQIRGLLRCFFVQYFEMGLIWVLLSFVVTCRYLTCLGADYRIPPYVIFVNGIGRRLRIGVFAE